MSKKCYYRLFLFVLLIVDLLAAGYLGIRHLRDSLPDTVYLRRGTQDSLENILDLPLVSYPETIDVSDNGSYRIPCSFLGMIPLKEVQVETVEDKWHMLGSMGGDGTPYVHAHCVASNKDCTVCGHLMPGTKVGSGDPELPSHFTLVIAKVSGVEWQAVLDEHKFFYQDVVEFEY